MSQINIMALRHSAFYTPLLMTIAGGYLQKQGLEPNYSVASPEKTVPDSIRNGQCHVAQSAVATSFDALERGQPIDIVHFAQINERDGFFLAARSSQTSASVDSQAAFNWHQLIGKKVLVDHFFQPYAMLKYGLHLQGIALDDLEVVDAGSPPEMERAFREGQADYIHLQGPAPQQMEYDGVGRVVAAVGDAIGPVAFSSLCASRDWLDTAMAKQFITAYRQSRQYVISAPAPVIAAQLQQAGFFTDINPAVLAATITAYQGLGCWTPQIEITRQAYDRLLDVFSYAGLIKRRHDYDAVIATLCE